MSPSPGPQNKYQQLHKSIWPILGCGHRCLQLTALSSLTLHAHNSQINSNKYCFFSFNNVDLLRSMLADCCMPRCWGWGTMVAVGWRWLPWPRLAGACIFLALASFHLGTSHVRYPSTPNPTNNQPTIHPIISVNNRRRMMFQLPSSAHAWWEDACAVWLHLILPSWGEWH